MKKINISKIKKELENLKANETVIELVINNAQMYNTLIEKFMRDEKVNNYLIYQLNVQITKQLLELKRLKQKDEGIVVENPVNKFIKNDKYN